MEMTCADCQQASALVFLCVEVAICLAIGVAAWKALGRRKDGGPSARAANWGALLLCGGVFSWSLRNNGRQLSDCFFDNGCEGLGWATEVLYPVSTAVALMCFWYTWLVLSDHLVERVVAGIKGDRE